MLLEATLLLALGVSQAESPPADRHLLMQALQGTYPGWLLDSQRMRVTGWSALSYTASSAGGEQLPMGFNYEANEFLLQQNWVRVERSVVTSGTAEPTLGFRSDTILPGTDYRFTVARGLFSGQLTADDGAPNAYGIDPVQFYAQAYFPNVGRGLDLKLGRFFSPYGVESIDATQTPLASRSYAFIYDPFTHTGLLATVQLTEAWTAVSGVVAGSDVFIGDPAARLTYVGGLKVAPPGRPDSLQVFTILGPGRYDVANEFNNPQVFDVVYARKCTDRLTYTIDGLFGFQQGVPDVGTAKWYGVAQYLTQTLTPRLTATARLEFFDDVDGNRTGFPGLYSAATAGLTYRPSPAVMFRPEVRYDYNGESRPFDDRNGLFTAAADLIVRW